MLFNIMLHAVSKHYDIQYQAAYSTQALCRSISSCIQQASIIPFNIMLHTPCKHYAVQYHDAYSTQALCRSISCCIQYALCCSISSIMLAFNIMLLHTHPRNIIMPSIQYHAAAYHSISCCIQHYAIQYLVAYSM